MMSLTSLFDFFRSIPPELGTFFLSMLPFTEMRAALPLALTVYKLSIPSALIWSFLGNITVIPIVFFLFSPLFQFCERRWHGMHQFMEDHIRTLEKKNRTNYTKYGSFFLCAFVAIPLPGTGIWTASLLAIVFNIKRKPAVVGIVLGQIIAMTIVLILTQGGIALFR